MVRFIKHAQELGFTLREIEELLRLRVGQGGTCAEVHAAEQARGCRPEDSQPSRDETRTGQSRAVVLEGWLHERVSHPARLGLARHLGERRSGTPPGSSWRWLWSTGYVVTNF